MSPAMRLAEAFVLNATFDVGTAEFEEAMASTRSCPMVAPRQESAAAV